MWIYLIRVEAKRKKCHLCQCYSVTSNAEMTTSYVFLESDVYV